MTEGQRQAPIRLLLIGPPGSGKTSQAENVAQKYNVEHISAGDLLRHEVEAGTDIGKRAADVMQRGELVPDELVYELVMPKVIAAGKSNGYVLDGFPRTVAQAQEARPVFEAEDVAVNKAVLLAADPDEFVPRLLDRARSQGRLDDTPDVIRARLEGFNDEAGPLVGFYRDLGLLHTVDACGSPQEVWAEVDAILSNRDVRRV